MTPSSTLLTESTLSHANESTLTATANSTSSSSFPLQLPSFGNGFTEVVMLTTLVGSASAESMVLGGHGAAGLAWAAMSSFGLQKVISACLSAACAGWLREIMGVRSKVSDGAVGMELSSTSNSKIAGIIRKRYAAEGPLGLSVDSRPGRVEQRGGKLVWKEIYAFDEETSRVITNIPDSGTEFLNSKSYLHSQSRSTNTSSTSLSSSPVASLQSRQITLTEPTKGLSISVYTNAPYIFYPQHHPRFQIPVLISSLLKVAESFALWWFGGSPLLSAATAVAWLYFFAIALVVEVHDLKQAQTSQNPDTGVDIITGKLPRMTNTGAGGTCKLILGASQGPRNSSIWRAVWGIGALLSVGVVVLTYIALGQQRNPIVFLWAAFQVLWTLVRIVVHHFTDPAEPLKHRGVKLMVALGSYLTSVHPRGKGAYHADAVAPDVLRSTILDTSPEKCYPLLRADSSRTRRVIEIEVCAVIGDPTLSSAAWMAGAQHLTPTDLYDSSIVAFRIPSSASNPSRTITIPCARVLAGIHQSTGIQTKFDEEVTYPPAPHQFVPKFTNNAGGSWCYFVPCGDHTWLFFRHGITMDVVGRRNAEVWTDTQVMGVLAGGELNISLTHVDDVSGSSLAVS
ncbi:hypothetical protein B0H34DRAFT_271778 [Crassisporium funariophilum]|nr:hypothetical protein B0H34DRAFT_271778 [Crassisporium funariophilum]